MYKFAATIVATACLAFTAQAQQHVHQKPPEPTQLPPTFRASPPPPAHKLPDPSSSPRFDGGPTRKHRLPPNGNPGPLPPSHNHGGHSHDQHHGHHTPPVGHGHHGRHDHHHGHRGHHHHHVHKPERFRWHGKHFWRYPGNYHGWSRHYFSSRYGCEVYWHPRHHCYYYWCVPHHCYYPVTYNPFGTYVFEEGVTYPEVTVQPVVTEPAPPRCGCGAYCPCRQQGSPGPDPTLDPDGGE
jgi:hypothetical protein